MKQADNNKKNKHLTAQDRQEIMNGLDKGLSFKTIALLVQKDPTTISYEVKRHRKEHRNAFVQTDELCPLLDKAPFVCNVCPKRRSANCRFLRLLYVAPQAHAEYEALLHDAREGIPLNRASFYKQDRIISSCIEKGPHIYHIVASHPELRVSLSTVYRHFSKGYYSASKIHLPRAVKFKPRKKKRADVVPSAIKKERTYADFLAHMEREGLSAHTQLDTVIGVSGGKVILTVHFTAFNFMFGLLLENKTAVQAALKFQEVKRTLAAGGFAFSDLMPVMLTDNGGDFSDVFAFENNLEGEKEACLFFCDPMQSCQKAQIEKNHTLFRDIVPKGSSFDHFTQDTVNLIFSHINGVRRNIYSGKSPYEMFTFAFSEELAALLGISYVAPEDVMQSPRLLKG